MKREDEVGVFLDESNWYRKDYAHKFSIDEQKLLILIAEILVKSINEKDNGKKQLRTGISQTK